MLLLLPLLLLLLYSLLPVACLSCTASVLVGSSRGALSTKPDKSFRLQSSFSCRITWTAAHAAAAAAAAAAQALAERSSTS
jgi:hypothetical protein